MSSDRSGTIETVTIETPDPVAAGAFHADAFGLDDRVRVRAGDAPTDGFRGFGLSLVVAQPSTVDSFAASALAAGAEVLKPVTKSFWGYGGVLRAPDGTIWKLASSAKKDTGPATREIERLVLLLGVADVTATRQFYTDCGITVAKSFGRKYVEFDTAPITLALYGRRAAAKDLGVAPDGSGSHRLIIGGTTDLTDPDGFVWEATVTEQAP